MKRELTPDEIGHLTTAVRAARKGEATLAQLAHAHDLAQGAMLNGTVGELRGHIRAMTPQPPMRVEAKSILLGVLSGILTHYIFRWTTKPSRQLPKVSPLATQSRRN